MSAQVRGYDWRRLEKLPAEDFQRALGGTDMLRVPSPNKQSCVNTCGEYLDLIRSRCLRWIRVVQIGKLAQRHSTNAALTCSLCRDIPLVWPSVDAEIFGKPDVDYTRLQSRGQVLSPSLGEETAVMLEDKDPSVHWALHLDAAMARWREQFRQASSGWRFTTMTVRETVMH